MKTIKALGGDHIYNVMVKAVDAAPARFTFNGMAFETREGETLGDARQRFKDEHNFEVTTPEEDAARARRELEETKAKQEAAIASAGVQAEAEMRDSKAPWPKTIEELTTYISGLVDRPHDYGTCVYAMSLAATAAFQFVAGKLGTTGFQASCADMDILRRTRGLEFGRVLNFDNLLYPQYCNEESFPSYRTLLADPKVRERLREKASELIASESSAHPGVVAHWKSLLM